MTSRRTRVRAMFAERKSLFKDIGTVAVGGLVEIGVETAVDMSGQAFPDIFPSYNTGDAVGALAAVLLTAAGIKTKKKALTLLGAGGLAVAVPNLVMKAIRQIPGMPTIPVQPIMRFGTPTSNYAYGNQGKYNRNIMLPTANYTSMRYPRR